MEEQEEEEQEEMEEQEQETVHDIIGREASYPGLVVCGWWCYSPFK